jgi:hypothetical protein
VIAPALKPLRCAFEARLGRSGISETPSNTIGWAKLALTQSRGE